MNVKTVVTVFIIAFFCILIILNARKNKSQHFPVAVGSIYLTFILPHVQTHGKIVTLAVKVLVLEQTELIYKSNIHNHQCGSMSYSKLGHKTEGMSESGITDQGNITTINSTLSNYQMSIYG